MNSHTEVGLLIFRLKSHKFDLSTSNSQGPENMIYLC